MLEDFSHLLHCLALMILASRKVVAIYVINVNHVLLSYKSISITVPSFARVSTVSFSCRQVCCSGKVDCTQCMTVGSANWRSR